MRWLLMDYVSAATHSDGDYRLWARVTLWASWSSCYQFQFTVPLTGNGDTIARLWLLPLLLRPLDGPPRRPGDDYDIISCLTSQTTQLGLHILYATPSLHAVLFPMSID